MRELVFVRMGKGEGHITYSIVVQLDDGKVLIYRTCLPSHKYSCRTHPSPDTVSSRFFLWTSTIDLFLPERNLPTQKKKPISINFQLQLAVAFVCSIKLLTNAYVNACRRALWEACQLPVYSHSSILAHMVRALAVRVTILKAVLLCACIHSLISIFIMQHNHNIHYAVNNQ